MTFTDWEVLACTVTFGKDTDEVEAALDDLVAAFEAEVEEDKLDRERKKRDQVRRTSSASRLSSTSWISSALASPSTNADRDSRSSSLIMLTSGVTFHLGLMITCHTLPFFLFLFIS